MHLHAYYIEFNDHIVEILSIAGDFFQFLVENCQWGDFEGIRETACLSERNSLLPRPFIVK